VPCASDEMIICYFRFAEISPGKGCDFDDLEPSEKVRIAQFAKPADRLRFAAGRRLARQLMAKLTHRTPQEIVIRMRCVHCGSITHGKPYAIYPGGRLSLSISHSANRVLVAGTIGPDVGVDIEQVDERSYNEQAHEAIESPLERRCSTRGAAAFIRLWTHKEAVLKCMGDGLMVSPKSFGINFSCNPPRVLGWTGRGTPIGLATLDVGHGYIAAAALAGTREFRTVAC